MCETNFEDRLWELEVPSKGKYELIHSYLSFHWNQMKELSCVKNQALSAKKLLLMFIIDNKWKL